MRRAVAAFLLAVLAPGVALAEPTANDKDSARALMDRGDQLVEAKDYPAALQVYQAADGIMHVPTTGIEVAKTLAAMGRLVAARDAASAVADLPEAADEPAPFATARADATKMVASLEARIPVIDVRVSGIDGATLPAIEVDGEVVPPERAAVPRPVDPGPHVVVAVLRGYADARSELTIEEGEKVSISLAMVPGQSSAKDRSVFHGLPALALAGFGVGGAGLVLGSVFGLGSIAQTSAVKSHCVANRCPASEAGGIASAKALGVASDVFLGLGLAGAGVGIVGLVMRPAERSTPASPSPGAALAAELVLGPGTAQVVGSF